jgi:hypothetical protein
MSQQDSEELPQSLSETTSEKIRWLIDPSRGLLLPLAGIWILALDWLLFGSNALTAGLATPLAMAIGFVVGGGGTLILQRFIAKDRLWMALPKALVAGIFVAVPWPLAGTLLGGWVLLAAGVKQPTRSSSTKS